MAAHRGATEPGPAPPAGEVRRDGEPTRDEGDAARRELARRRRRAAVFGEVLPAATTDDRGETWGDRPGGDDWLRSQVPPHHG